MAKITAALNMTIDGVCDHTVGLPDEKIHQHYTELLNQSDAILYGRITYRLMEFWRGIIEKPSDEKSMNEFAAAIDKIPKIVFSNTIKNLDWKSAEVAKHKLEDEVLKLKKQSDKNILVGSRSLIIQLLKLNLIDEFQLCIYPMVAGGGLALFEELNQKIIFELIKTKTFKNGTIILYYQPQSV